MMLMGKRKKIAETMSASERTTTTVAEALTFCCYQRRTPPILLSPLLRFLSRCQEAPNPWKFESSEASEDAASSSSSSSLACNPGRRIEH
jgi:hypothetical protein